jgi:hypothetical protein
MLSFIISSPAYLKPPLQIRVPHLHKAMSPNVTEDTVIMVAILFQKPFFSKKYQKIQRRSSKRKLQDMVKSKKWQRLNWKCSVKFNMFLPVYNLAE